MKSFEEYGIRIAHSNKLFIDGTWVAPLHGRTIDLVSPASGETVGTVAEATIEDVDQAVRAARAAFDDGPWPRMAPADRIALLYKFSEALAARREELASAWMLQVGALPAMTERGVTNGLAQITNAIKVGEAFKFAETCASRIADRAVIVREPIGVVAAISAWNGSLLQLAGKLGPALVAGCTVVMKPALESPLEAFILAECVEAAGLPKGVVNLVVADRTASEALVSNPRVDKVSFTGSTIVGRHIAEVCARRLSHYTLELGGKSAAIILDDFPIERAAKILAGTITALSGQLCCMLSRVIVSRERHDALVLAIAAELEKVKVGAPDEPGVTMGPIVSARQLANILRYIDRGIRDGARLVFGGSRPEGMERGFYVQPTLFANVDNHSVIAQEEIFGPVMCVIAAQDEDDAIRIANESDYGLHGAVFSTDSDKAYAVAKRIRTGSFGQNGMRLDFSLPFGGYKQSGVGRDGGEEGLMNYLLTKTVLLDA